MHPYADTFIPENLVDKSEPVFPLEVYLNPNNGNIQLGCVTNDFDRYNLYDYSYTSSNSNFSKTHWRKYKDRIVEKFNPVDKLKLRTEIKEYRVGVSVTDYVLHHARASMGDLLMIEAQARMSPSHADFAVGNRSSQKQAGRGPKKA
jgi:hypothetical protein